MGWQTLKMSNRAALMSCLVIVLLTFNTHPLTPIEFVQSNDDDISQLIKTVEGMSAIGYSPLWRVGLSADGIDLGMPQLSSEKLPYSAIVIDADGWRIYSKRAGWSITLIITREPGQCSISKQWYPYRAKLELRQDGHPLQSFNGIAMGKGQKPLPPHPSTSAQDQDRLGIEPTVIYHFMDVFKFGLMQSDYHQTANLFHYPLQLTSSAGHVYTISSKQEWIENAHKLLDTQLLTCIIDCKYHHLSIKDGLIGVGEGLLLLKLIGGKPKVTVINAR